jgi:hypothetical protein
MAAKPPLMVLAAFATLIITLVEGMFDSDGVVVNPTVAPLERVTVPRFRVPVVPVDRLRETAESPEARQEM